VTQAPPWPAQRHAHFIEAIRDEHLVLGKHVADADEHGDLAILVVVDEQEHRDREDDRQELEPDVVEERPVQPAADRTFVGRRRLDRCRWQLGYLL
jgi:hypothetical protein